MFDFLPNSDLVQQIVQVIFLIVLILVACPVGLFLLAFAARGATQVKREFKRLVSPEQLDEVINAAQSAPGLIRPFIDEPTDIVILMLARALRDNPDDVVQKVERWLSLAERTTGWLPKLRELLGLDGEKSAAPPDTADVTFGSWNLGTDLDEASARAIFEEQILPKLGGAIPS